uniref:Uncharacterized protein n=1 Tax=Rhizophora mucronata TaxID=61149 RepID=A0A2P2MZC1_RHIMU
MKYYADVTLTGFIQMGSQFYTDGK